MAKLHLAQQLIDILWPVGSVYISTDASNPSTKFGGTWSQITGRFLLGCDSTYPAGSTGGSKTHNHPLSAAGGAAMRKYANTFYQGDTTTAGRMPSERSTSHWWGTDTNTDYEVRSLDTTRGTGIALYGSTDNREILPPYLAVYMWRRTA